MTDFAPQAATAAGDAANPLPAMPASRDAASRLRRGGLLRAAAGLLAATAVCGAQASIVYSGALNTSFNTNTNSGNGVFFLIDPTHSVNLAASFGKGPVQRLTVRFYDSDFDPLQQGTTLKLFSGAGGDLIGGGGAFSSASSLSSDEVSAGTTSYFGFRFDPVGPSTLAYGWMKVTFNADGAGWVLQGFAYENAPGGPGTGILTGDTGVVPTADVPEPGTVPLVAAAGLAAAFFRRRRRVVRV